MAVIKFLKGIDLNSRGFIFMMGVVSYLLVLLLGWVASPSPSSSESIGLLFLITTQGALIGGAIGALISPSESGEKETFKAILGIASTVLAGVIWKTFETELHFFFANVLPMDWVIQVRFLSFSSAMFMGAFVVFAYRAYGQPPNEAAQNESIQSIRAALGEIEKKLKQIKP
jgi:hypothetical protein